MSLSEQLSQEFDPAIRFRGSSYYKQKTVKKIHVTKKIAVVSVQGEKLYKCRFELDPPPRGSNLALI